MHLNIVDTMKYKSEEIIIFFNDFIAVLYESRAFDDFPKAMVTIQSGDRSICSLLGRRWNLGIAQRFIEKSSR